MKSRVLHVIDHTGSGGAQVVILYILRTLKDLFSFSVAVLGNSGKYSDAYRELDVPLYNLGKQASRWNPLTFFKLVSTMRRGRFDLIHSHLFKANVLGTIAGRFVGCKTILHDHSDTHLQSLRYRSYLSNELLLHSYLCAYRYALDKCDRVIVLTPETFNFYVSFYSADPSKVVVLPDAVAPFTFTPPQISRQPRTLRAELGLSPETSLVVMVGRLEPEKDWQAFLRVAAEFQHIPLIHPCAFLIVGSGAQEQQLRNQVRSQGLQSVFFLGNRHDVPNILSQANVFLLTSRHEAFGVVLLEAMAAGCPVVSTRCGGPESILRDGIDGLLVEVDDVPSLVSNVRRLLEDHRLRDKLSKHARQTVLNHYSLDSITERLVRIYEEVLRQ